MSCIEVFWLIYVDSGKGWKVRKEVFLQSKAAAQNTFFPFPNSEIMSLSFPEVECIKSIQN